MKRIKLNLLTKIVIAIILGIVLGGIMPMWAGRVFATINSIFSQFLNFSIPLIILALVASSIGKLGIGAGKILIATVAIAYTSTLFSGYFTYGVCSATFPSLLRGEHISSLPSMETIFSPFFTLNIPPVMGVMTALILAFVIGIGLIYTSSSILRTLVDEFSEIITKMISNVIIPMLPLYIFCIFLSISASNYIGMVMGVFSKVIIVILILHIVVLILLFSISGSICKKNPFTMLKNMLPAYMTALGTASSAATIPVTLKQTLKNGVSEPIAGMVVPLCATIHMPGSMLKIVSCAMAIMMITGMPFDIYLFSGFIFMLGITAVAAPGVPGGVIMAALGILQSILGFDQTACALMVALYVALDSFGTACNVTGDGAIAAIVDHFSKKLSKI
ncbi:MAG: dicarboxylate/amino acid:cation symporter [Flavobacteriales bacterium]|nr:dicarboxylate/amino acid:cation symporter [Flavobacteriales bacterium]